MLLNWQVNPNAPDNAFLDKYAEYNGRRFEIVCSDPGDVCSLIVRGENDLCGEYDTIQDAINKAERIASGMKTNKE